MRKVRRLPFIIYTWLVIVLGIWLLYYTFPQLNLDLGRELLIMVGFGVLAEWLAVSFPQGQLTGGFAVILSTYLIYGPVPAAWVNALATVLGQGVANRGNPLRTTLFNAAQYVPVVLGANFVYVLAGGEVARGLHWANGWPLTLFILAYYLFNQLFVYIYTLPVRGGYPLLQWPDALRWDGITYLLAVPVGLLMVLLYNHIGIYGTLLLFIPMLAVQFVLRFYVHLVLANRELRVLYEVAGKLGGNLNLKEIFDLLLRESRRVTGFHNGIIYLWSEEKQCYVVEAATGTHAGLFRGSVVQRGEGFLGRAALSGECHLVDDAREDERTLGDIGFTQLHRSLVVVPLVAETGVLGLLVLGDKRAGFFDDKHVQILTILGGQAAVAIANVHLKSLLDRAAITDGLTGLYNYRYFYHRCLGELERARRYDENVALVMVDINNFKQVNDHYGHSAGDAVLAAVAGVIRDQLRDGDLAARFGGDEFAVLLPRTGPAEAKHVADRLRLAVREYVFEAGERRILVYVTTATATFPGDAAGLDELFKVALKGLEQQ
ncbi:sensor domain-containing diguanylate cyclase [Desulfallas thermosapovorans]|uniref:sensor domain-containing diguanylate cyclase n=1 Tax=Desulfallas thermosapovorans TaxID=58137 RepID=UPI001412AC7D|nr:sensor domain-containing diguanylate cyclase [Desulfallas thermosapovorans]